jgi:hypothetical protein
MQTVCYTARARSRAMDELFEAIKTKEGVEVINEDGGYAGFDRFMVVKFGGAEYSITITEIEDESEG